MLIVLFSMVFIKNYPLNTLYCSPIVSMETILVRKFLVNFTGKKINVVDHPDYAPSRFPNVSYSGDVSLQRFQRKRRRDEVKSSTPKKARIDDTLHNVSIISETDSSEVLSSSQGSSGSEESVPIGLRRQLEDEERKQLYEEIDNLKKERDQAIKELEIIKGTLISSQLKADSVRDNDKQCKVMTGITWVAFNILVQYMSEFYTENCKSKLPMIDQLFITLVKFRQNPSSAFLEHILKISHKILMDMLKRWLDLLHAKISFLVHWPDRDIIHKTVPTFFKSRFPKITCIVDCFEIFIESPKRLLARAQVYSTYKKHTTVKYFVGCHPSGAITYLSTGWGGRGSDVDIVRHSDFLSYKYHQPGDLILADRGFTMHEDFACQVQVVLKTPSYSIKGKSQMPAKDVESSRVKSNVRIHIERMIDAVKRRFRILDGPLPIRFVKSLRDERYQSYIPTIDKLVTVSSALVNLENSIVTKKKK